MICIFWQKNGYQLHCPFGVLWKSEITLCVILLFMLIPKLDSGKTTLNYFGKDIMKTLLFRLFPKSILAKNINNDFGQGQQEKSIPPIVNLISAFPMDI